MFRFPFIRAVDQRGQSTAEYALVLLGVAAVALALLTWAAGGRTPFNR